MIKITVIMMFYSSDFCLQIYNRVKSDGQIVNINVITLFLAELLLDNTVLITDSTKNEMHEENVKLFLISSDASYNIWNFKIMLLFYVY